MRIQLFHQHFSLISLMVSLVSFFTLSLVLFFRSADLLSRGPFGVSGVLPFR